MTRHNRTELSCTIFLIGAITAALAWTRSGFALSNYPWIFPDSFDWIVNGLAYASVPEVTINHRPILYPLVVAALERYGLLDLSALYGTVGFFIGEAVLGTLGSRAAPARAGLLAAIFYATNAKVLAQSAVVGADVTAAALISLSALSFLRFLQTDGRRWLGVSILSAALSSQAQYLIVILIPVLLIFSLLDTTSQRWVLGLSRLRKLASEPLSWGFLFAGLSLVLLLLLPRIIKYAVVYEAHVAHVSLISPSFANAPFYLFALPAFFSWPIVLLAILGTIMGNSDPDCRLVTRFASMWAAAVLIFFAILYSYVAIRFLIYAAAPIFILASIGARQLTVTLRQYGRLHLIMLPVLLGTIGLAHLAHSDEPFNSDIVVSPVRVLTLLENGTTKTRSVDSWLALKAMPPPQVPARIVDQRATDAAGAE